MPSGGARVPAKPAAVSGPGAHSRRTDGGPADKKLGTAQLAAGGGSYGARQAIEGQAAAAPVVTGGAEGGGGAAGPVGAEAFADPFGPTERPNEPISAGALPTTAQGEAADVEMTLRALYAQFPTPYLGRLLNG